jgi:hypothetical protein
MSFIDMDQFARAGLFGGIALVSLFAVLWLWYDTSGRDVIGAWYWRIATTLLVALTVPALVLGAANLDVERETLLNIFAWMAIGCGAAAVVGVVAYAVWGRNAVVPEEIPFPVEPPMPVVQPTIPATPPPPGPPPRPRPAYGHFVVKSGPERGKQYPLYEVARVGRSSAEVGSDGIVIDDRRVSGMHAQVKLTGGQFVFTDLNSTNGSYLVIDGREERLRGSQALVDGDEIRIGHTVLQFIDAQNGRRR